MVQSITKVGILSCGEMGLGIAKVLVANKYKVFTFASDRSQRTQDNAREAGVELCDSIKDLATEVEALLSIVPPRDAYTTAQRFAEVVADRQAPLIYLDLNATSTATAKKTAELFELNEKITLIDGGIIGGVPYPLTNQTNDHANCTQNDEEAPSWHCPNLLVSGPTKLHDPKLSKILNIDHLSDDIGAATGVKMCFAATTKGFISLAIQSYTTAHQLGVLDNLREYLAKYNSSTQTIAEKGLVTMPPKAYRWVGEMREIGDTFEAEGGFKSNL